MFFTFLWCCLNNPHGLLEALRGPQTPGGTAVGFRDSGGVQNLHPPLVQFKLYQGEVLPYNPGTRVWVESTQSETPEAPTLLAGVIFEKYILAFQIQIFGFKYKIQEGLKPDRNNAREGGIVGRDAEGARRGLCAACPPRPRGATAAWRPDRLQWQIVQVVPSRPTSVRTQWHTGPGA